MATTAKPTVLESGDLLTQPEFHERYCARPDIKKAELVEGVVYVASPVRFEFQSEPTGLVLAWLGSYASRHPGVRFGNDATVILDDRNEVQPDALLWRPAETGAAKLTTGGYIEGAPELIVEVAASSASYDLHAKKEAYRRNGVLEYVVWRTIDEAIDWFRLERGNYLAAQPDEHGIIESTTFPGLRLHVGKMLGGHLAGVLAELT